jgi:hypothetical protein
MTYPSTHLTFRSKMIELTPCPRMLNHITAYEAGPLSYKTLTYPHPNPKTKPRCLPAVFRVPLYGRQALTWSCHLCNTPGRLCQQQGTVQKSHVPCREVVIRPLQYRQFNGWWRRYSSINSLLYPSLYWNPIHAWQSIQANYINSYTSASKRTVLRIRGCNNEPFKDGT